MGLFPTRFALLLLVHPGIKGLAMSNGLLPSAPRRPSRSNAPLAAEGRRGRAREGREERDEREGKANDGEARRAEGESVGRCQSMGRRESTRRREKRSEPTVAELRTELRRRGLRVSGRKAELICRLESDTKQGGVEGRGVEGDEGRGGGVREGGRRRGPTVEQLR
ncbi:MAG: hypothetical protein SGPRY_013237, partial [Prymnesium sp.]